MQRTPAAGLCPTGHPYNSPQHLISLSIPSFYLFYFVLFLFCFVLLCFILFYLHTALSNVSSFGALPLTLQQEVQSRQNPTIREEAHHGSSAII